MGKATNARRKAAPSPIEVLDGPTEAQQANGRYARDTIIHAESARTAIIHINRGGTPLARWRATPGMLSDSQNAAINHCIHLWDTACRTPSVTAQYGERIPGHGNEERAAIRQIDARDSLWRIIDYFPGKLRDYYSVFENVCRFDMPAGVAGSTLSNSTRTAEARAHQVVCFVADIIAMNERI